MPKLHWSEIAEADLDDIYDYIARDVPYYAKMFVDRLIEATDKLEEHPRLGRKSARSQRPRRCARTDRSGLSDHFVMEMLGTVIQQAS